LRCIEQLTNTPCVDAIILGEGEAAMLDLTAALSSPSGNLEAVRGIAIRRNGVPFITAPRAPLIDLDSLPEPGRYIDGAVSVDPRKQLEFIVTSRGCPASCRFCSSPGFWGGKIRFRSPTSMVNEIRYLRDSFGLIYFSIRDDTFTADRGRVIEFCRQLIAERIFILWNCQSRVNAVDAELLGWMKRAGCECIQLGIESGSQKVLDLLGKRITPAQIRMAAKAIRLAGINLSIYLITGVKGETDQDILESSRLVSELSPSGGHVSPLVYYPGTAMFEDAVTAGAVAEDLFESSRDPACLVCRERSAKRNTSRLMAALEKAAGHSGFSSRDFSQQKKLLGYCHTTNLLSGESYLQQGASELAEREFLEIVSREPDNPWGWLSLGEMQGEAGELERAIESFQKLAMLVPSHAPAFKALGELYTLVGDKSAARENFEKEKLLTG
jgi:radical SAM superfamily enzyme YgiQ (UPF0313 family)